MRVDTRAGPRPRRRHGAHGRSATGITATASAWIDCLARGRSLGRSIARVRRPRPPRRSPARRRTSSRALALPTVRSGPGPPVGAVGSAQPVDASPPSTSCGTASRPAEVEAIWCRRPVFFHPLDLVAGWNRIYGRRGFLQYQMVVPDGAEETVRRCLEALSDARCASFLAVLKRFGAANPAPAVVPPPGLDPGARPPRRRRRASARSSTAWTRWSWQPAAGSTWPRTPGCDPSCSRPCIRRLPDWRAVRDRLDPERRLRSDLARCRLCPTLASTRRDPGTGASRMKDALGAVQSVLVLGGSSEIGVAIAAKLAGPRHATVILAGRHPEPRGVGGRRAGRRRRAGRDAALRRGRHRQPRRGRRPRGQARRRRPRRGRPGLRPARRPGGRRGRRRRGGAPGADQLRRARCRPAWRWPGSCEAQGHGTLVVLSSVAGERVRRANFIYGSSKAGLDGFAQGLGDALAGQRRRGADRPARLRAHQDDRGHAARRRCPPPPTRSPPPP